MILYYLFYHVVPLACILLHLNILFSGMVMVYIVCPNVVTFSSSSAAVLARPSEKEVFLYLSGANLTKSEVLKKKEIALN